MSQDDNLSTFDFVFDLLPQFEISGLTQNSTGEENQGQNGFPGTQSPLTGAGGWVPQVYDTQYQGDPQTLPISDQEIPKSQHAEQPEPWTPYAVVGMNQPTPGQVACPSPTMELPYGHVSMRAHSVPINHPCYSQSTMWSAPSEPSSRPVHDHRMSGDFTSNSSMEQASRPTVDPTLLNPNWPHQPENDTFVNWTITDVRSDGTPSVISRASCGGISRRRRPPRSTPEPREGPYFCKTCGKKFDTPGDRNHHEIIHGEHPFACPNCPRQFVWQKDLLRHMTKHTKAKDYKCSVCGKGFSRRDNCRRHEENYHSGNSQSSRSSQLGV